MERKLSVTQREKETQREREKRAGQIARGVAFTHIKNAKSQRLRKEEATGALSTEHYNAANIFI